MSVTLRAQGRRPGGVAVLVALTAIALSACGGGQGSPTVASLANANGKSSRNGGKHPTVTLSNGDPTKLLDEWASCMRRHGDPNQADPTVGANKVINLAWWPGTPGGIYGTNKGGQGNVGPGQYCRTYLDTAQTDLQGGEQQSSPDEATLDRYSACMRANGIPDFPDPKGNGLVINIGGDTNPANPTFRAADRLCAHKTGVRGFGGLPDTQPGGINFINVGPGGGSGANGGG